MKQKLSHLNQEGEINMVDISGKPDQQRIARASGFISLSPETIEQVKQNSLKKGDVLSVARIAGVMAAKQTHLLIPLCHPLQISKIDIDLEVESKGIKAIATAKCIGKTGIEMEALTAVSIALLTIYDMCKAVDKKMVLEDIRLLEKTKSPPENEAASQTG
ncbi:cyclic pyranopterin monophosphate synthase MoaC [Bacteroidota bacterium]